MRQAVLCARTKRNGTVNWTETFCEYLALDYRSRANDGNVYREKSFEMLILTTCFKLVEIDEVVRFVNNYHKQEMRILHRANNFLVARSYKREKMQFGKEATIYITVTRVNTNEYRSVACSFRTPGTRIATVTANRPFFNTKDSSYYAKYCPPRIRYIRYLQGAPREC